MSNGSRLSSAKCTFKPKLTFSYLAWSKMWKITENNKEGGVFFECTCFGIMDPKDPTRCINIWVPKQVNTPAHTDADDQDRAEWAAQLIADGIDLGQVALWHHSHASIGTFWSDEDLGTIRKYAADNIQWSVVTNARGDIKVRADLFEPVRYWWDDCEFEVEYPELNLDSWWDEVSQKMTNKKPPAKKPKKQGAKGKSYPKKGTKALPSPQKQMAAQVINPGEEVYAFGHDLPWNLPRDFSGDIPLPLDAYLQRSNNRYLTLSHPLIQAAYDEDYINEREAEQLDLEFVTGDKTNEDLERAIIFMVAHNLKENGQADEVEDVVRFLKSSKAERAYSA